jgi:hypothetical protein
MVREREGEFFFFKREKKNNWSEGGIDRKWERRK